jgi:hypothetical protein
LQICQRESVEVRLHIMRELQVPLAQQASDSLKSMLGGSTPAIDGAGDQQIAKGCASGPWQFLGQKNRRPPTGEETKARPSRSGPIDLDRSGIRAFDARYYAAKNRLSRTIVAGNHQQGFGRRLKRHALKNPRRVTSRAPPKGFLD